MMLVVSCDACFGWDAGSARCTHNSSTCHSGVLRGASRHALTQPLRGARTSSRSCLALCAFVSVATTVGIVVALFVPAIEFFREISIVDFLTGTNWAPLFEPPAFGVSR